MYAQDMSMATARILACEARSRRQKGMPWCSRLQAVANETWAANTTALNRSKLLCSNSPGPKTRSESAAS